LTDRALIARWSLGNGAIWTLAANFGDAAVTMPAASGRRVFTCGPTVSAQGELPGKSLIALLHVLR
jgi:hypothetical protein